MAGTEICTYSSVIMDPLNPDYRDIRIEDIAHSLASQCRFTGHTKYFFSVAQHSVEVSRSPLCQTLEEQRWGLLHDATEAYLSDLARPIKHLNSLGEIYRRAERGLEIAVAQRFKLKWPIPKNVKKADDECLFVEAQLLMPPAFWKLMKQTPPLEPENAHLNMEGCWIPYQAEVIFLERYDELF